MYNTPVEDMSNRQYPLSTIYSTNSSTEELDAGDAEILLGETDKDTSYPWQHWYGNPKPTNKRHFYVAGAMVLLFLISALMYKMGARMAGGRTTVPLVAEQKIEDRLSALNGPPTPKFRGRPNFIYSLFSRLSAVPYPDRQSKAKFEIYFFLDRRWMEYVISLSILLLGVDSSN